MGVELQLVGSGEASSAPHISHAPMPIPGWLSQLPTRSSLRAPFQMLIALFFACLFATSGDVSKAFFGKGLWAAITVALALEPTVGGTWRKASQRAVGTFAGGALGAFSVALTGLLCNGWQPGAPKDKVLVMSFIVACLGAGLQHARAGDKQRDYAYSTAIMTLVLTSLADFSDAQGSEVLESVGLRIATITLGGLMSLTVSLLILPEYAFQASQEVLAAACRTAGELVRGVVAEHFIARKKATVFDSLHAHELRLATQLERYNALVSAAAEERTLHLGAGGRTLDARRAGAAGAAARGLFTGAVSMLHVLEAGPRSEAAAAMVQQHGADVDGACGALLEALRAAAALAERGLESDGRAACDALRALDAALAALTGAAAESAAGAVGGAAVRDAHRELSALVASLADASQCVARVVSNMLPDVGMVEQHWTAQRLVADGRQRALAALQRALEEELEEERANPLDRQASGAPEFDF